MPRYFFSFLGFFFSLRMPVPLAMPSPPFAVRCRLYAPRAARRRACSRRGPPGRAGWRTPGAGRSGAQPPVATGVPVRRATSAMSGAARGPWTSPRTLEPLEATTCPIHPGGGRSQGVTPTPDTGPREPDCPPVLGNVTLPIFATGNDMLPVGGDFGDERSRHRVDTMTWTRSPSLKRGLEPRTWKALSSARTRPGCSDPHGIGAQRTDQAAARRTGGTFPGPRGTGSTHGLATNIIPRRSASP
jgi:hypothetical protein